MSWWRPWRRGRQDDVPAVLSGPGAVVATSNKADVYTTTAAAREADTGQRACVFDPQHFVHAEQLWWWN